MIENELLSVDDGTSSVVDADASLVAQEYYTSYAKYVLEYRALPSIEDGLKPVQRRVIYTANQFPKKLMKTANLVGSTMSLHPHGDSSIEGAINDMAWSLSAFPMFTTKGNFGGVGFGASASRYTELYLSEAARMNFCQFVDYADYEVGEIGKMEPTSLPCLIPYALIRGSEGIGVGLSTKIMPLNLIDLIDYYIDYIKNDGHSKRMIKPDLGYVLLTTPDYNDEVFKCKGRVSVSSIVTQVSNNTLMIEGVYGKSMDAVVNKVDKYNKYFTDDKVGYRNASTTSPRYIFEIYDSSVSINTLKENLIDATKGNATFTRVVEENGSAVYSGLGYMVKKSLECLNKAIDKKIETELSQYKHQLTLYEVLRICKDKKVFDNIASLTVDELVRNIISATSCTEEVARDIVKKPISHLTSSHASEEDNLRVQIDTLENHDRKKYLISLYKDLKKCVLPYFNKKKHTLVQSDLISDPRIKVTPSGQAQVTNGDGESFKDTVYFVSDKGYVHPRGVSSLVKSEFTVDGLASDETIVGVVTDKSQYLTVFTNFPYSGWYGALSVDLSSITYDKKIINLREDKDKETIVKVVGYTSLEDKYSDTLKSRVSKSKYYEGEIK